MLEGFQGHSTLKDPNEQGVKGGEVCKYTYGS